MATKVTKQSVTVKDVPASELVKAYAAHLKREGKLEVPKWADLVKTSNIHELGPLDADWFYVRAGIILAFFSVSLFVFFTEKWLTTVFLNNSSMLISFI